ncbi:TonB-dependent siderophore receptor [Phenylobacterium sp. LjRoot219]|uniref:TonB-dependent receptor n=1 Tax=Phenylobacterium sp. LjRoot219 TaxID=3342283 RepID=UPI003ECECEE9
MGYRNFALASAAAAALLGASPAWAQAANPAPTSVSEVVVTAGSQVELTGDYAGGQVARGGRVGMFGAMDLMDTPFVITSYTSELMLNQQARSVADVLQNDPSVRVAKGFGNFQELYVIRGFPVYSDDMTYNGVYGILPRQYVAAEFLERVEVFHGANAFLNGAAPGGSAVGGAFNLVPKRAPDAPLTRFTAGWETGGSLLTAADVARRFGPDGDFGVRGNLVRRSGETSVKDQGRELTVAALGLDYRGDRARFSADVGYQDHHIKAPRPSVTPLGEIPAPPEASSNFAQPWTFTDERQLFGVARGEADITDDLSVWAAVGGRDGREKNVLSNPSAFADGTTTAYRFDNRREDTVISADAGVRFNLTTGPVDHRLVGAGQAVKLKSKNAYAFSSFAGFPGSLYTPTVVARPATDFFIGGVLNDPLVTERTRNTSFALADMMSFLDDRVLFTAGVRWQEIYTRTFDYNDGSENSRYKSDAWTPAFALVVKPNERISVFGNYSQALIPGQTAPDTVGGVPVLNAGTVLAPFRGKQYELGMKVDYGTFGGSLSAFQVSLPSAFVQDNLFQSNGKQRHRGLELSAYGQPVENVRLLGGATYIDPKMTRTADGALDGNAPIGVPEFTANLDLEWDVPAVAGLTLEGRAIYTGEQWANATNTVELKSWTRFDLGVRYAFEAADQALTLRARVENVADKDYWASAGGYPGANYLVLGTPRTFIVSASVDF